MVTSYFMMNLSRYNKKTHYEEYYNKLLLHGNYNNEEKHFDYLCRICLNFGSISMLTSKSIMETVTVFSGIKVSETDMLPKHLCSICYNFIKACMLFKKVAKKSEKILQKQAIIAENLTSYSDSIPSDHISDILSRRTIPSQKRKTVTRKPTKVVCKICSKQISKKFYKNHLSLHDPNHKRYVCETCGKTFKLQCTYHTHSMIHLKDFPHKCALCPYKAKYSSLLTYHMRTHNREYKYICNECPKRFLFKGNFNRHMLRHKEPKYNCDKCKKAFFTNHRLQQHFESEHLGIKNHICNLCGKAFGRRHGLRKHMLGVHKEEKVTYRRMPSYMQAELLNNPPS